MPHRRTIGGLLARGLRDHSTGCLIWTGGKNNSGYGTFRVNGRTRLVHRVAYELWVAKLKPRQIVAHTCDQPACFEPTHLEATSQRENIRAACLRGRAGARLPVDLVRRLKAARGKMSAADAALHFGISQRHVNRIWSGRQWGYVDDDR